MVANFLLLYHAIAFMPYMLVCAYFDFVCLLLAFHSPRLVHAYHIHLTFWDWSLFLSCLCSFFGHTLICWWLLSMVNLFQHHPTAREKYLKGPFGWRNRKVEGWKTSGRIEKIWFSLMCVWLEGWKSGRVENFFVWLERKMRG